MENQEAINVLIQVAHLAQHKGLFALADAVQVAKAIEALTPKVAQMSVAESDADVGGGVLVSPRNGRPK